MNESSPDENEFADRSLRRFAALSSRKVDEMGMGRIPEEDYQLLVALAEGRLTRSGRAAVQKRLASEPELRAAMGHFFGSVRDSEYGNSLLANESILDNSEYRTAMRIREFFTIPATRYATAAACVLFVVLGVSVIRSLTLPPGGSRGTDGIWRVAAIGDVQLIGDNESKVKTDRLHVSKEEVFAPISGEFRANRFAGNEVLLSTGNEASVYERVAPSVVFLTTNDGFATGFVFREAGWILTNNHVASSGMVDESRRIYLNVVLGSIDEETGFMTKSETTIRAFVYKWDPAVDLALLRVDLEDPMVNAILNVSPIEMRGDGVRVAPDEEVRLIGNAGSGFLWSIKSGRVSSVSQMKNLTRLVHLLTLVREGAPGTEDVSPEEIVASYVGDMAETYLIEASVESRPGDSGGPLVDLEGKLVGIAFAGLSSPGSAEVERFYYIHASEVEKFMAEIPDQPLTKDYFSVGDLYASVGCASWLITEVKAKNGERLALLGFDNDNDLVFLALDADADVTRDALGVIHENRTFNENLPARIVENLDVEFIWCADYQRRTFIAVYATPGPNGVPGSLNEIRVDTDFDGAPDDGRRLNVAGELVELPDLEMDEFLTLDYASGEESTYREVFRYLERASAYLQKAALSSTPSVPGDRPPN